MSARKLGHFAGLVFVLAAILGGFAAAGAAQAGAEGASAVQASTETIDWE